MLLSADVESEFRTMHISIFCTWLVSLSRESLIERAGGLSRTKLEQLANALRLARIE